MARIMSCNRVSCFSELNRTHDCLLIVKPMVSNSLPLPDVVQRKV